MWSWLFCRLDSSVCLGHCAAILFLFALVSMWEKNILLLLLLVVYLSRSFLYGWNSFLLPISGEELFICLYDVIDDGECGIGDEFGVLGQPWQIGDGQQVDVAPWRLIDSISADESGMCAVFIYAVSPGVAAFGRPIRWWYGWAGAGYGGEGAVAAAAAAAAARFQYIAAGWPYAAAVAAAANM